ncbi:RNA-binding protein 33-like isoform X2 [Phlebotomus argentipes]|nr:RNA-binding protein 33-like isoform X2 [Phlebotomus argentipes]XP_059609469.1 RNA-binding protein 33-like isoform X2 [Phlebotomus argentipes]
MVKRQQRLEKVLERIHVVKIHENEVRQCVRDKPNMISEKTLMISVDALRDDGRVLKHFNIPIELPRHQPPQVSMRALPIKKRYHLNQVEKTDKTRKRTRRNILKGMLLEPKMQIRRTPARTEVICQDAPLDLSRIPPKRVEKPPEIPRTLHLPSPGQIRHQVHHPIPLRYVMQPYAQARAVAEPREVPRFYPQQNGVERNVPPQAYPHVIMPHNPYQISVPLCPAPARYPPTPPAPLPERRYAQTVSYPQYPYCLPQPSVIYHPRTVEKPISHAFHPPQYVYPTHQLHHYPAEPPQRPQYAPPVNESHLPDLREMKVSERMRIQAPKAHFSDEIPIFRVRNPAYRVLPTHETHPSRLYFSHGTQ